MKQLDLFPNDPNQYLYGQLQKLKDSTDDVRRCVFWKINFLEKLVLELKDRIDERNPIS